MYKHILLPTDGSATAREAIRAGVKLAKSVGARVTGFYAAPPATPIDTRGSCRSAIPTRLPAGR